MNKTIRVNPNHFMFAKQPRKTKDRASDATKEEQKAAKLKIKMISQEENQRERLIKMLLKQQEKNFKQRDRTPSVLPPPLPLGKTSELNTSLDHLLGIVEEVERKKQAETEKSMDPKHSPVLPQDTLRSHQGTLKQYPITDPNVSMMFPSDLMEEVPEAHVLPVSGPPIQLHAPKYGCLKYGKLPTYREYKQQITQKQTTHLGPSRENPTMAMNTYVPSLSSKPSNIPVPVPEFRSCIQTTPGVSRPLSLVVEDLRSSDQNAPKPTRQRKVLRRTFKIGKSPLLQRVSVLLSNRTLRKQVNNRTMTYKKTPMNEVKAFLARRGLIKVGTIAPNNVLRQMYEDAMLTRGEIYNHNPDVLLHNFMNQ